MQPGEGQQQRGKGRHAMEAPSPLNLGRVASGGWLTPARSGHPTLLALPVTQNHV